MDWQAAGDEAVEVLLKYLMVPTINPPGDEVLGVNFWAEQLAKEEIGVQVLTTATTGLGDRAWRARATATPLCMLHHIDGADKADKWEHHPSAESFQTANCGVAVHWT